MAENVKKAIITGGTGYIGSSLTRQLVKQGWEIGIIKRPNSGLDKLESFKDDLEFFDYNGSTESLKQAMETFHPDIVFHLASCFIGRHKTDQIEDLIHSNVLFGTQLLEAMQLSSVVKIINASTSWQTVGGMEYNPFSLYTSTKQAFEDILHFYTNTYGIKAISLRLPDSYGADDTRAKILNLVRKATQSGEQLKMSGGEQEMDLLYINDIVDGFIKASELLEEGQRFNVNSLSSRKPMPLKKIVEMYETVNNVSVNIEWGALPYRDNEIMKITLPDNVLPQWESKVPLEEGLRKFELDK
ncbi:NAD(P)-dependent oxidoreductase [Desulfosporosinus sp. BICA1-9]|uniref:NAD-dependent epimerase/dehydratase family protein n=1 Tax=Desulfosporosinus sp. BICA1-9 TaxID=1531958 RepID=UPI00054B3049|nr:NAD(P)-dependent oxidoreductase [Desulfosporosinus sp. BICA1-9]KJS49033.1 MAG: hypothetical protein VR66_10835 [Peptococcaceae bacterium BRH_c23]KJS90764.1 MAG: hypothetical protein JL57_00130 [Desulfosporosinus sp. BICA1-9]HBW35511.1 NAD(P)-dependent oxidoreductase [Desulfosporosinus sp.]